MSVTDGCKNVLVSGASFAGLATAFWMRNLGYDVTVVEIAESLKLGGTPVNIRENTVEIVKRMGLLDRVRSNKICMQRMSFKNAADVTVHSMAAGSNSNLADCEQPAKEEYEIERNVLLNLMFDAVKDDVDVVFGDSIVSLQERESVDISFKSGTTRSFDLVFGCDDIHSAVRKLCFGGEAEFRRFLGAYFSITIIDKLLIRENTTEIYNEPGRAVMLNAYNGKTDIVLCFASDEEISYDYRDEWQQRRIIVERFSKQGWRTSELLEDVKNSGSFYFDQLCQIKMPSWTKGRVALVGDAGYCASPAAGAGGSLAIDGAAALADALVKCRGDIEPAFQDYNRSFRPFIEAVQAQAVRFGVNFLVPRTAEAIDDRNSTFGDPVPANDE